MSYAVSRYLTLWLRDAARVKDPHFTLAYHRVSSTSVVRASVLAHGGSCVPYSRFFFSLGVVGGGGGMATRRLPVSYLSLF